MLQDSLCGSSKVLLVANLAPEAASAAETLSSLSFAARAAKVLALPYICIGLWEALECHCKFLSLLTRRHHTHWLACTEDAKCFIITQIFAVCLLVAVDVFPR